MKYHIGTSGYSYPAWKGKFYPEKLPAKQMLRFYGEHFSTAEINGTFKVIPKPETIESWINDVPKPFKFVLKAQEKVTHRKRLRDAGAEVKELLTAGKLFGSQLGPILFQLPPNFKKDLPRLSKFLKLLPPKTRATFEFRHPSWFDDETFALLRRNKVALCIADAGDELKVPFVATTNWGYLRLRRDNYTRKSLQAWAKQIQKQKWNEVFIYFKHEDEANGPRFAKTMMTFIEK